MFENHTEQSAAPSGGTPVQENTTQTSPQNGASQSQMGQQSSAAQSLVELDKAEKFRYQGKEWTLSDLEKAILRQQDYTKKTQELAKSRESFEQERKFAENLAFDLIAVRENPSRAADFIRVYPEKYHKYLEGVTGNNQQSGAAQSQREPVTPQVDIRGEARLQKLEKVYHDQEVQRQTQAINAQVQRLSEKYPDAIPEMAVARMYEVMQANAEDKDFQVSDEMWEDAFKQVSEQLDGYYKKRYDSFIKKQTEANAKARDVESGGGTPGRAPAKFKNLAEVTKHAVKTFGGGQ